MCGNELASQNALGFALTAVARFRVLPDVILADSLDTQAELASSSSWIDPFIYLTQRFKRPFAGMDKTGAWMHAKAKTALLQTIAVLDRERLVPLFANANA